MNVVLSHLADDCDDDDHDDDDEVLVIGHNTLQSDCSMSATISYLLTRTHYSHLSIRTLLGESPLELLPLLFNG